MTPDEPLGLYADYVCPFCFLQHRLVERYREREDDGNLRIEWRPYDLRGGMREADGDLDLSGFEYPDRVHRRIADLREEYGVTDMLTPEDVPKVDSLSAQVASQYVASEYPNRWAAFDSALFEALWRDGRDINDPAVLADRANENGVDAAEINELLEADARANDRFEEVFERFAAARDRGVADVPTFEYGGRLVDGVLTPAEIRALLTDGAGSRER